jgi:hypothetical protein
MAQVIVGVNRTNSNCPTIRLQPMALCHFSAGAMGLGQVFELTCEIPGRGERVEGGRRGYETSALSVGLRHWLMFWLAASVLVCEGSAVAARPLGDSQIRYPIARAGIPKRAGLRQISMAAITFGT